MFEYEAKRVASEHHYGRGAEAGKTETRRWEWVFLRKSSELPAPNPNLDPSIRPPSPTWDDIRGCYLKETLTIYAVDASWRFPSIGKEKKGGQHDAHTHIHKEIETMKAGMRLGDIIYAHETNIKGLVCDRYAWFPDGYEPSEGDYISAYVCSYGQQNDIHHHKGIEFQFLDGGWKGMFSKDRRRKYIIDPQWKFFPIGAFGEYRWVKNLKPRWGENAHTGG